MAPETVPAAADAMYLVDRFSRSASGTASRKTLLITGESKYASVLIRKVTHA